MKVLVVAAHPDDEVLGIGGTLKKHSLKGDDVYALILGEGITARYDEGEEIDQSSIDRLRSRGVEAGKILGLKKIFFEHLQDNRFDGVERLEIIKIVEKCLDNVRPDIVYTHHYGDINIDHQLTFEAVLTATRPIGEAYPRELYAFETVSSTEWYFGNREKVFHPDVFVDITDVMEQKLMALECYRSEMRDYPHPRSTEGVKATAQRWGTVVSRKYVEPLETIRVIR